MKKMKTSLKLTKTSVRVLQAADLTTVRGGAGVPSNYPTACAAYAAGVPSNYPTACAAE